MNRNFPQDNNWIVWKEIDDISNGRFKMDEVNHIYFAYLTGEELITAIELKNKERYFIHNNIQINEEDNENTDEKKDTQKIVQTIKSDIKKLASFEDIEKYLSTSKRKLLNSKFKRFEMIKVNQKDNEEVLATNFMDVIHDTYSVPSLINFIKKTTQSSNGVLNLSNLYCLTTDIIEKLYTQNGTTFEKVENIILNQNYGLNADYAWISKTFPNVKIFDIINCQNMTIKNVANLVETNSWMIVLNFHRCANLDIRVIKEITRYTKCLQKLAFDDVQFICQYSENELLLSEDEWKCISGDTLQYLMINSKNLTLDVVDYLVKSFKKLEYFFVDENILKMIERNIQGGINQQEQIIFASVQDQTRGLKYQKTVSFKNLFKDKVNRKPVSDSMLKRIKESGGALVL